MKNCGLLSLTKVTAGLELDASNPLLLTRCPKVSCPLPILKRRNCLPFRTIRFKPETEKATRIKNPSNRHAQSSCHLLIICALHCNEIIYYDYKLPFYYPNLLSVLLRTATALHTVLLCTSSEKINSLRSRGHCCQQKTNIKP